MEKVSSLLAFPKSLVKNHHSIGMGSMPLTINFMRNTLFLIVTFLAPSFWMKFFQESFVNPNRVALEVEG